MSEVIFYHSNAFEDRASSSFVVDVGCFGSRASKGDLIKILGNESQFQPWVNGFLCKGKFVEEICESNHYFCRKTKTAGFAINFW